MFDRVRRYLPGWRSSDTIEVDEIKQRIEVKYRDILKEKSTKEFTVGPEGGTILLPGCRIRIPPGALRKKITFELTLSIDYLGLLYDHIPISPVLSCKPFLAFDKPVTVSMKTTLAPLRQNDGVSTFIYSDTTPFVWKEGVSRLQSGGQAEFETKSLDSHMLAMDSSIKAVFQMLSHVYIHKETALVVSFLCWNDMIFDAFTEALENNGFHRYMYLRKHQIFAHGDNVEMNMVFKAPKPRMLLTNNQQKFDVNAAFLRSSDVRSVFYKLDPLLDEYTGPVKMEYTITLSEMGYTKSTLTALLEKEWPPTKRSEKTTATAESSVPTSQISSPSGTTKRIVTAIGNSIAAARDVIVQNIQHGPPSFILVPLVVLLVALILASIYYNVYLLHLLDYISKRL